MKSVIWARVADGVVIEIFPPLPVDLKPGIDIFPADWACVDVSDVPGLVAGWHYDGKTFAAPQPNAPTRAELQAYANAKQQALFDGGLIVDVGSAQSPAQIYASLDGQSLSFLNGAADDAEKDQTFSATWVSRLGVVTLSAAQILAVKAAVSAFVQGIMATLGKVLTDIQSGEAKTTEAIDAYAWPAAAPGR